MTRWLVTGSGGQLGHELVAALATEQVTALDRAALDITDPAAVDAAVAGHDVVINAAAYTGVDAAESDEPAAFAVNGLGVRHLARASARHGARLVQVSTDYVFDGCAVVDSGTGEPVAEDAAPRPLSAYGRTKLAGEWAALAAGSDCWVVRTQWVYGAVGNNFVATMRRLAAERDTIDVVADQFGSPTWSADLAAGLIEVAQVRPSSRVLHCTNIGYTTWFGLAQAVFAELGLDPARVRPTTSAQFRRPAPRPTWAVLSDAGWRAAGLAPLRPWRSALEAALAAPWLS